MKFLLSLVATLLTSSLLLAQAPHQMNVAEIEAGIERLNVLGSVLYVAAHPDDENTNLIAYLSNARHYETRYISLTRGDGGQNLIGQEIREQLGVLRTEELMAARGIDGGKQSFSRANDFGYSKTPEETLNIWQKDSVLADLVWAVRCFQPDVIINRFWHGTERPNHGHHTASAQLGLLAFELAADPNAFPEQLKYVKPWKAKRILCNISWWFYGGPEAFEKIDKSKWIQMDINQFYAGKGLSNRELAALSRSQHRCQAMGTMTERSSSTEYFEYLKGDTLAGNDPFGDVNTSWNRIPGGQAVANLSSNVLSTFDHKHPEMSLPSLVQLYKSIEMLPAGFWRDLKLQECRDIIAACLGLYTEAAASDFAVVAGDSLKVNFEVTLRNPAKVNLKGYAFNPAIKDSTLNVFLAVNKPVKWSTTIKIPDNAPLTTAYWLQQPWEEGVFQVADQQQIGAPRTKRFLIADFTINVNGLDLTIPFEVAYKFEEPSKGEIWRPLDIVPPATVRFLRTSYVFGDILPRTIQVEVRAGTNNAKGELVLDMPEHWTVEPKSQTFNIAGKGELQVFSFEITPGKKATSATLDAQLKLNNKAYNHELSTIAYDHIPSQLVLRPAITHLARTDLKKKGINVGYVVGAGDDIPNCLRDAGYNVTLLTAADMQADKLMAYDAILLGIRAYNTQAWLKFAQPKLYEYAQNGGALIVQYNTNFDLLADSLLPLSFKLSRERVIDQNSKVNFLLPKHPTLTVPNELSDADFANWTQERGLYFASEWSPTFEAPLGMADANEPERKGSLIVSPYGKGYIAYTGLAFFRQLPAGVPGAYRLMSNLIGLGKGAVAPSGKKKRGQ